MGVGVEPHSAPTLSLTHTAFLVSDLHVSMTPMSSGWLAVTKILSLFMPCLFAAQQGGGGSGSRGALTGETRSEDDSNIMAQRKENGGGGGGGDRVLGARWQQ